MHTQFSFQLGATLALLCLAAMMAGCSGGGGAPENADAWRNIRGTHECFPFRIENGQGFEYEGINNDDPCTPIVSRADWVISEPERTFVLYDVDPLLGHFSTAIDCNRFLCLAEGDQASRKLA